MCEQMRFLWGVHTEHVVALKKQLNGQQQNGCLLNSQTIKKDKEIQKDYPYFNQKQNNTEA